MCFPDDSPWNLWKAGEVDFIHSLIARLLRVLCGLEEKVSKDPALQDFLVSS